MQITYSGVNALVLAAVLLGVALCLQGCVEVSAGCATGVIETYGEATGKILAGPYGEAVVECNAGLIYQGPDLKCVDLIVVCPPDEYKLGCAVTPGFLMTGVVIPPRIIIKTYDQEVINAESKQKAAAAAVALAESSEVVCTNWPASNFKDWAELTPAEQEAATALGYTTAAWDGDKANPTASDKWEALNEKHQEAATALGWTQPVWDGELAARKAYLTKKTAAEAAANPVEGDGKVKKVVTEDVDVEAKKFAVQRINVGGGVFTPMGVSFVLCMCLVLAVSIRAVTRSRPQSRSVDLMEADPELLEAEECPE